MDVLQQDYIFRREGIDIKINNKTIKAIIIERDIVNNDNVIIADLRIMVKSIDVARINIQNDVIIIDKESYKCAYDSMKSIDSMTYELILKKFSK